MVFVQFFIEQLCFPAKICLCWSCSYSLNILRMKLCWPATLPGLWTLITCAGHTTLITNSAAPIKREFYTVHCIIMYTETRFKRIRSVYFLPLYVMRRPYIFLYTTLRLCTT